MVAKPLPVPECPIAVDIDIDDHEFVGVAIATIEGRLIVRSKGIELAVNFDQLIRISRLLANRVIIAGARVIINDPNAHRRIIDLKLCVGSCPEVIIRQREVAALHEPFDNEFLLTSRQIG